MTSRLALAADVLAILARDGGRTDADLIELTGASPADLSAVIGMLYRQHRADRCAGYLVAVPSPARLRGVSVLSVTPVTSQLRGVTD